MRKIFIILLITFMITSCAKKEKPQETIVGGWMINNDLSFIDDETFNIVLSNNQIKPIFIISNNNDEKLYFCFETNEYKIVKINNQKYKIFDFNFLDYLDSNETNYSNDNLDYLPNLLKDEEKEIFNKGIDDLLGVSYQPILCLGKQVVAGYNYAFLALGKTITLNPINNLYVIKMYQDLKGNVIISNICPINLSRFN